MTAESVLVDLTRERDALVRKIQDLCLCKPSPVPGEDALKESLRDMHDRIAAVRTEIRNSEFTPARAVAIVEYVRDNVLYQMRYRNYRRIREGDHLVVRAGDETSVTKGETTFTGKKSWYERGPFFRFVIEVHPMLVDRAWKAAGSETIDGMLIVEAKEVGWSGGESVHELKLLKVHYGQKGVVIETKFLTRTADGQRILSATMPSAKGHKTRWDRHVGIEDWSKAIIVSEGWQYRHLELRIDHAGFSSYNAFHDRVAVNLNCSRFNHVLDEVRIDERRVARIRPGLWLELSSNKDGGVEERIQAYLDHVNPPFVEVVEPETEHEQCDLDAMAMFA
jgi:hypothetical protein